MAARSQKVGLGAISAKEKNWGICVVKEGSGESGPEGYSAPGGAQPGSAPPDSLKLDVAPSEWDTESQKVLFRVNVSLGTHGHLVKAKVYFTCQSPSPPRGTALPGIKVVSQHLDVGGQGSSRL